MGDDERDAMSHSPALSWRDVYTAVEQMEGRMTKVLERIEQKFDNVVGDHETRIRKLEVEGSIEAQEALRTAKAVGVKYDALKDRVDNFSARENGIFGTLKGGQQLLLVIFGLLGALSVFLHLIGVVP